MLLIYNLIETRSFLLFWNSNNGFGGLQENNLYNKTINN